MTISNDPTASSSSLALCTAADMAVLRQALDHPGLMGESIAALVSRVIPHMTQQSAISGHGEAGSYAHNQHQLNCRLCEEAGTLYQITSEKHYAEFAADLLSRYAIFGYFLSCIAMKHAIYAPITSRDDL